MESLNGETRNYVLNVLKSCQDRVKKISLLRYELEHPAQISPDEMIDAMSFGRGEGTGSGKGRISNKTLYNFRKVFVETPKAFSALSSGSPSRYGISA